MAAFFFACYPAKASAALAVPLCGANDSPFVPAC